MKDKVDLIIIELEILFRELEHDICNSENLTRGEEAALSQEIYAVNYSINILKELKK